MCRPFVRRAALLGLLLAALVAPCLARAAEVQVAFDPAGRIQRVDEPLARRIGLFLDKYPDFQEARLFMADDSSFVLEVVMMRGGQLRRERELLTRGQADTLRADVVRRVGALAPVREKLNQDGRALLLAGSATLGLGFYGWAVPVASDAQDPSIALGSYMLTAGASFFVPLMLTQNQPVTWGMANLSLYGATRGIAHGLMLYDIAHTGTGSTDDNFRAAVTIAMVTSIGEGALGYAIARQAHMNGGTTQAIENGGDYGLLWGFALGDLAGRPEGELDRPTESAMLATTAAGMIGAGVLASHRAYSYGDGLVMRSSGYVGMLLGTAIADVGNPDDSRPYSAGLLAGSLAGLIVGDRLVAGREFTGGEGVLVHMGGAAGALMGLGVVALGSPEGDNSSTAYWFGTAIGGAAGYALTYHQLARKAAARAAEGTSWRFELSPEGLLAAMGHASGGAAAAGSSRAMPPLARITCTF
jgi:hypothetical protein